MDHSGAVVAMIASLVPLVEATARDKNMAYEREEARVGRRQSWRRKEEESCREMLSRSESQAARGWMDLNRRTLLRMAEREGRGQG